MSDPYGVGHGRPNDARGFIHKTILGIGGRVLSAVGGAVPLPGAGILRFADQLAQNVAGGPRTQPSVIPQASLPPIRPIGAGPGLPRLPESGPMGQNRRVGITPQDTVRSALSNGCPTACAPVKGNRRVNAAGECAPPGWHWNVSGYHRRGGPCSKFEAGFVEAGTVLVRNRRMDKANGPAQERSLKRLEGAQDHAKRILRATGWRTISKKSSREMQLRPRRGHR